MSESDRVRWNERYREGAGSDEPSGFLLRNAALLPGAGRALDVAGGRGRHAIWLAGRGLDVTLVDVADEAIRRAEEAARTAGVSIHAARRDLEADPLPEGPWDLVVVFHYLQRDLLRSLPDLLVPGGIAVVSIATVRNLERHERPPRRHVLEEGELPRLLEGLDILVSEEGWLEEGRHEARIVGRRP